MSGRTTHRTVKFRRPFCLGGFDNIPAGSYDLETEEELLTEVSFPAYRRTATFIFLPAQAENRLSTQMVRIDHDDLASAEAKDTVEPMTAPGHADRP